MSILVVNCGSTTIKLAVLDPATGARRGELLLERLGATEQGRMVGLDAVEECPGDHAGALAHALPRFIKSVSADSPLVGVGHRVVHGGSRFRQPTEITDDVAQVILDLSYLAPLHNPNNHAAIVAARALLPDLPHVAVFDTAFHATLPNRASTYALPHKLTAEHGIRRYGFHGPSHQFVATKAAEFLREDSRNLRTITCHLGGGCSVCAVEYGRSVETSMGMTPLEGLAMGTRSGDVDPGSLLYLLQREKFSVDELDHLLNRESGLAGMSGKGSDMRDIEAAAEAGDDHCRRALQVFCHRVRKYVGAYAAVMGGVDVIVFTAGIGANSVTVRHRVAQRLEFLGARLDETRNRQAKLTVDQPVAEISSPHSRVRLLAIETDEMQEIARQTAAVCQAPRRPKKMKPIPVAISARHVHLTQETVEQLFGPGHQLTPWKELSQPGQYAAEEQVTLVGPRQSLHRVRILGPTRPKDQVEISRSDEFFLGIDAPVRASGDVENSPGITLEGTDGRQVDLACGVICAWRHIHMTPNDAAEFSVANGDVVSVEVGQGGGRSLTFGDVLVRVKPTYRLEMHIDTDEGNAAELDVRDEGALQATNNEATIQPQVR